MGFRETLSDFGDMFRLFLVCERTIRSSSIGHVVCLT